MEIQDPIQPEIIDTRITRGLAVLQAIMADPYATGRYSLADLYLADHGYPYALPRGRAGVDHQWTPAMIDHLAETRRTIQRSIAWRERDRAERLGALDLTGAAAIMQEPPTALPPTPPGDGGSRVPVPPRPIVRPPSAGARVPDLAF